MAIPSVTYSFSNGSVASAPDVNTNFQDILNAISDGTGDLSFNTLTLTSTLTANGNVTLGNASGDTMTVNATPTFASATTFSSTTTFNGAPTFNAAVTVGAYDVTVNTDTFFVDASEGKVAIGTNTVNTDGILTVSGNSDDGLVGIVIDDVDTGTGSKTGYIDFRGGGVRQGRIQCTDGVGLSLSGEAGISLAPPLTIDPSGFVGVGTLTPTAIFQPHSTSALGARITSSAAATALDVASNVGDSSPVILVRKNGSGTTNNRFTQFLRGATVGSTGAITGGGTTEGYIRLDGSGNLNFENSSDATLKENIKDISGALVSVLSLKPRQYDWIDPDKPKNVYGFIAQEVEPVFPRCVYTDPDTGLKSISMESDLLPVLVKAIQEQQAEIDSLKARLDALESA